MKTLRKSIDNKILFGVVGGIGEYFKIDPTIFRLALILVGVFTGIFPMVLIYILSVLVVPGHSHK